MASMLRRLWTFLNRPLLPKRKHERGIALLVVVGSLAILTSVAVEFRFQTSIDLQLAANARDGLRAEYLARSGVNLSRLLLRFQKQLSGQLGPLSKMIAQFLQSAAPPGFNIPLNPQIQLWKLLPVDEGLFSLLSGAAPLSASPLGSDSAAFGEFQGSFSAQIDSEETKVNLNRLNATGARGAAAMIQTYLLFSDPRLAFVFEQEDAWRIRMKPEEVLIALHDWIDPGDNQASVNLGSAATPWGEGSGDENRNYQSKYPYRYNSKNAAFDSIDEIYQVDGCSDIFGAAFRDRMTVWADKNHGLNPNSDDPLQTYLSILTAAVNPNDPKLSINPPSIPISLIFQSLGQLKALTGALGGITVAQFVAVVEASGIAVKPEIKARGANQNNLLSDKTEYFTIKSVGKVGKVEKTLTVVLQINELLGKVMYYREE